MKQLAACILIISAVAVATAAVAERLAARHGPRGAPAADSRLSFRPDSALPASITVDYPAEGSIFPPEITAPTFLWHDAAETTTMWQIDVVFADGSAGIRVKSRGERLRVGDIDPRCVSETNELPKLSPQLAAARSWIPDAETWAAIKRYSVERPATVTITGFQDKDPDQALSRGRVTFQTSDDPVGAPIFYRDVPLMPSELEKGVIKPLAPFAAPLIGWRLRNVGESRSRLLLEGIHTCANCHSFSRDGKTLGMDLDGPQNDKGTYAIVPVKPQISIRNEDVITWNSYPDKPVGQTTVGYLAQLSPNGQFAVVTLNEEVYVANFKNYRFLQVFYPTRGILAWYRRVTGQIKALPGADDPHYVQTNAVWSPDGEYLIFARADAKDAYPRGRKMAEYANDPNETPIQYDLYRIPFNEGKGGRAEPVVGASRNGMSNTFPKVSPDGRWIVFVQCRNGQLMRPDSQLYIVPAEGGQARRMQCNTTLMNSWHSFSPNGRWLVFSSKDRSPYTQMYLTHLDEEGHDSPAILIENATAANRAVNIPEFVNIPAEGLLKIDVPAAEFYRLFDSALELGEKGLYEAAIAEWQKALELSPDDAKAHNNLGVALVRKGNFDQALTHFQRAAVIKPRYADAQYNLGGALAQKGKLDEAIAHFQKALEVNPNYAEAHYILGETFYLLGRIPEALAQWREGLRTQPNHLPVLNRAAWVLATCPESSARSGTEAVELAERAVQLSGGREPAILDTLAAAYAEVGRFPEAVQTARRALGLAIEQNKQPLAEGLKARIVLYEAKTPFRETRQPSSSRPSRP